MNFKISLKVFCRDIKRIFTNPVAIIVFFGIMILPCLYAWCSISALMDPYSNTGNIKVGIVNNDQTVHNDLTGDLQLGEMLEENLRDNDQLNWQFNSEDEAMKKLDSGEYYAVIIVPENFSSSVSNIFSKTETKDFAEICYYVNERPHPISVKVMDTATDMLEAKINQKFAETVTSVVTNKVNEVTGGVIKDAKTLAGSIESKLHRVSSTVSEFNGTIDDITAVSNSTKISLNEIEVILNEIVSECNNINNILSDTESKCITARQHVTDLIAIIDPKLVPDILYKLESSLDESLKAINKIKTSVNETRTYIEKTIVLAEQTKHMLDGTSQQNINIKNSLDSITGQLDNASQQIVAATAGSKTYLLSALLNIDNDSLSQFMESPVKLVNEFINPVDKYGIGIAPFFSCIAFWIGGFVLLALVHTEVKNLKNRKISYRQGYIARGMLYSLLGMGIGAVCTIGDIIVGVSCENPVLFVMTGMIASCVFANILFMLGACFKHLGKAFAVILIILQIPGSNGMLPIEMMPGVIKAIHPLLPFTYGIEALRETIVAFNFGYWLFNICILLIMWLLAVLIGANAGRVLTNINALFEKKLATTGLFEVEHKDHKILPYTEVKLDKTKVYMRTKYGVWIMAIVPAFFLTIMCVIFAFIDVDIDTKAICILIWIILLFACAANIILAEFDKKRIKENA